MSGRRLEGRVALVTGAASGIGAACARRFAEEGARVAGIDLAPAPGDGDWAAAVKAAPDSLFEQADVCDEAAVNRIADATRDALGSIDVLVNAAGVPGGGAAHQIALEDWDRTIAVNLRGTLLPSRAVLPGMLEQRSGSIIHIASVEGIEGFEGGSAYNASKGAVVLLTRNMAIDYGRRGIRVNAICPGFIDTPMLRGLFGMEGLSDVAERIREAHQLGRFGRAEEIANAALFLASDESSFVTGVALPVDGGYTAGHRFGVASMMGLD
ncbi:MAG: SDR family NAD(P)-dependent oxidoreductase [Myxococcota bacterium]|nr:SDR family NAD(P)-dependent oxidoreductase [Myxococcota bacterium]